jgi:hypothetical protein
VKALRQRIEAIPYRVKPAREWLQVSRDSLSQLC